MVQWWKNILFPVKAESLVGSLGHWRYFSGQKTNWILIFVCMIMHNTHIVEKLKRGLRNYLECFNDIYLLYIFIACIQKRYDLFMITYDIKFFDVISRFWSGQSITRHLENMTWWHSYAYIFFVWSSMIIVAECHSHANAIVFKYAKKIS